MATNPEYPTLPAVDLAAGSYPIIIIDTREQDRLPLSFQSVVDTLPTGDYSYRGGEHTFAIERKSLADLVGCLGVDRERFQRQLDRLRAYEFKRLLIVGDKADLEAGNYRSRLNPTAALNSLCAIEARYCPIVWASTPQDAATLVQEWAFWHYRELIKAVRSIK
jgi:DNA excision repair protein ERCC-4